MPKNRRRGYVEANPTAQSDFRKKRIIRVPQTDPLKPDFDIHTWLEMRRKREEENLDDFAVRELQSYGRGYSDCVTAEEYTEQKQRMADDQRREAEAKRAQTDSTRRAS